MFEDDRNHESFEEAVRSIARELSRSIERLTDADPDEVAQAIGLDLGRVKAFADGAVGWLRAHAEGLAEEGAAWGGGFQVAVDDDSPSTDGPHPLDRPTDAQGMALAAMDSGRWSVRPGSGAFASDTAPATSSDALGLADELRARDWITADGEITLAGRHALRRWLRSAA